VQAGMDALALVCKKYAQKKIKGTEYRRSDRIS
jgi:hypothetical protein